MIKEFCISFALLQQAVELDFNYLNLTSATCHQAKEKNVSRSKLYHIGYISYKNILRS